MGGCEGGAGGVREAVGQGGRGGMRVGYAAWGLGTWRMASGVAAATCRRAKGGGAGVVPSTLDVAAVGRRDVHTWTALSSWVGQQGQWKAHQGSLAGRLAAARGLSAADHAAAPRCVVWTPLDAAHAAARVSVAGDRGHGRSASPLPLRRSARGRAASVAGRAARRGVATAMKRRQIWRTVSIRTPHRWHACHISGDTGSR